MSETALATTSFQGSSMKDEGRMIGPRAVALRDIDDVDRFAELIYKSTLVPKEYRNNKADVVGVIVFGLELGLNPMQALQNVAWINGKPSVYGDMLLALVEASGLLESFDEIDPDEALRTGTAMCTVKRRGRHPIARSFTKADAETAKLWTKDIWRAYPGRMLQMRARSWALRDAFSDVLKGLIAREEAQDIIDVTPQAIRPEVKSRPEDSLDDDQSIRAWLVEQIMMTLKQAYPGPTAEDRTARLDLIRQAFGVRGWSDVGTLPVETLQAGYQHLQALVTPEDETIDTEVAEEDDVPLTTGPNEPESTLDESSVSTEYDESLHAEDLSTEAGDGLPDNIGISEVAQSERDDLALKSEVERVRIYADSHGLGKDFGQSMNQYPNGIPQARLEEIEQRLKDRVAAKEQTAKV